MHTNQIALAQLVDDRIAGLQATAGARRRGPRRTGAVRRWFHRRQPSGDSAPTLRPSATRPPAPFTDAFAEWATAFAMRVATDGLGRSERSVSALVSVARRHQVSPVVVGVLTDRSAPAPARDRALGTVLVALSGSALRAASSPAAERDIA
jgi:hypothetical protein